MNICSTDSAIWTELQKMLKKEIANINTSKFKKNTLFKYSNLMYTYNIIWSIWLELDSLVIDVGSLKQDMKTVKNKILNQVQSNRNADLDNVFFKKYAIKLPVKNKDDFKNFNDRLNNDTEFRSNFVSTITLFRNIDLCAIFISLKCINLIILD